MGFQRIKRWQWVAISLIAGVAMGWLNRLSRQDWTMSYGESLSLAQFETAVKQQTGGIAQFSQLMVVPDEIQIGAGERKPVHVVTGQYYETRSRAAGAGSAAGPSRRCFVAEIPFTATGTAGPVPPAQTVMNYLARERIAFGYAWWRDPKTAMALWTGGSFVVIGLIWPTLINLLVYRSLFAPAQAKGIDLSKVSSGNGTSPTQPPLTESDLAELQKLESELEAGLAQSASEEPASPPPPSPETVKPLNDAPLEVAASDTQRDATVFGAKKDDYYPTARKPRDRNSDGPR